MEFIFELVFQIAGEVLLQVAFELAAELGFHSIKATVQRPRNSLLSTIGFALLGAVAGGVSLLLFPQSPITNPGFRRINLVLTPLAAGGIMMLIGRLRDKRGSPVVKLDRFGYAFVFALAMALVRFVWAQ